MESRTRRTRAIGGVAALLAAIALNPASAAAVDTFVDDNDPAADDTGACTAPAAPCETIVAAVGKAGANDTIHVGGGTYNEQIALSGGKSLLADNFQGGGFTTLPAIIDESDGMTSTHAIRLTGDAGTIEGFTIRSDGIPVNLLFNTATVRSNTFDQPDPPAGGAAGAAAVSSLGNPISPTIEDNTFTDPTPNDTQTAISVSAAAGGSPTIAGNDIDGYRVGIQLTGQGTTTVSGNTITGTHSTTPPANGFAEAIQVVNQNPTIVDNEIDDPGDKGGTFPREGILLLQSGPGTPAGATIRRNEIRDHDIGVRADNITGAVTLDSDLIVGSLIHGIALEDTVTDDAGVSNASAQNVTVVGDSGAPDEVSLLQANLTIDASIVGDLGVQNNGVAAGLCTETNSRGPSAVAGDPCTPYTSNADPTFVNAASGNYHLAQTSPLIDAGDDQPVVSGSTLDFEGDDRVLDGDASGTAERDMGADEFDIGDDDGDGVPNATDNCPANANPGQQNSDGDAQGNACDADDDNDGVNDGPDNCNLTPNPGQANSDGDAQGNACDADDDNDGVNDGPDNCNLTPNPGQANSDGDAQGNACDPDDDNDGRADGPDNCDFDANPEQTDSDRDGRGDVCDPTPHGTDVDLELGGKKKVKVGRAVKVSATCPEEACAVTAQATFKVPTSALTAATKKLKTKLVTESLGAGVPQTLKLRPKRRARRALRAVTVPRRVKVVVAAVATDLGGNTDAEKRRLKLK